MVSCSVNIAHSKNTKCYISTYLLVNSGKAYDRSCERRIDSASDAPTLTRRRSPTTLPRDATARRLLSRVYACVLHTARLSA